MKPAVAICPDCGKTLPVRVDERIARHWKSELDRRHNDAKCVGSELDTRHWKTVTTTDGPARFKRKRH